MIDIYYYDGKVIRGEPERLEEYKNFPLWIDVVGMTPSESAYLQTVFELHPLTSEDLANERGRVKIEEFENYLLCIFYGIEKSSAVELIEVDFVVGKEYIITNHTKDLEGIKALRLNEQKMDALFKKGSDFFLHYILDKEVDNYAPALDALDDEIENIEELVAKDPSPKILQRIQRAKHRIMEIKKVIVPQREKIAFLFRNDYKFISKKAYPYFRDVYDHVIRVADLLESNREAIASTLEIYMTALSYKMNEVMKTLSIIATIALPLTVISGIYGTNFAMLPGSDAPNGFWIMILSMFLLIATMLLFFRRRRWF